MAAQLAVRKKKRRPYHYRDRTAQVAYDRDFQENFRFKRSEVELLQLRIAPYIESQRADRRDLSMMDRILIYLRYVASTGNASLVGDATGCSKATVIRYVKTVACAINEVMLDEQVNFPSSEVGWKLLEFQFSRISGIRHCVGTVDGCHFYVKKPSVPHHAEFINRHGTRSLNSCAVVGPNLEFLYFDASKPGGSHDAHIFRNTELFDLFENQNIRPIPGCVVLGDSAYPILDWLIPSYRPGGGAAQADYNMKHNSTRNVVERAFGVLKTTFPRLGGRIDIKNITTVSQVVTSCVVLHNYRKRMRPHTRREIASIKAFKFDDVVQQLVLPQPPANFTVAQKSKFLGQHRRIAMH